MRIPPESPDPLSDSVLQLGLIRSVAGEVAINYAIPSVRFLATDGMRHSRMTESDAGTGPKHRSKVACPESVQWNLVPVRFTVC